MGIKKGPNIPPEYKRKFFARIKVARQGADMKIGDFEEAMELPPDTYKAYETKTMLPYHLVEKFCRLTEVTVWWLLTGKPDSKQGANPDEIKEKKSA